MGSVDVAIPSYQYGAYLRTSATSVLTQDVSDLRLLIVDNASTDGSQAIARDIAAHDDRVTLFLNEENRGMFDSYNRAIDWATADYLVILDADDILAAGSLKLAADFMDQHPDVAFAYGVEGRLVRGALDPGRCDARTTKWDVISGEEFIRQTCRDSFCDIGAPALVIRVSALKKAGHLREELVRTNDFEMYLRLAMFGSVARTNRVLGVRRIHEAQLSCPYDEERVLDFIEHEKAFDSFFTKEGAALPNNAEMQRLSRRGLGDYAYWYAVIRFVGRRSDWSDSFRYARQHRRRSHFIPPVHFLFKKRWPRSAWRAVIRKIRPGSPLPDDFEVPRHPVLLFSRRR